MQNKRFGLIERLSGVFRNAFLSTGFEYRADNSLVMCKHTHTSFSSGHLSKTVLLESIAMVMNDVTMIDRRILFTSQFLSTAIASQSRLFLPISLFFFPFVWFPEHFWVVILKYEWEYFVVSKMCWEWWWTEGGVGKRDRKILTCTDGDRILSGSKKNQHLNNKTCFLSSKSGYYIYTLPLESLGSVRFFMFFKEVSSAHQGCIYLIKNTGK